MKLLILLLVISVNSYSSCHESAGNVDLRKSRSDIMSSLPIQDQGPDGYCYAYTGKFLYDFQRYLKTAKNKGSTLDLGRTSPAWAAAIAMKEGSDFNDEGGAACNVVKGLSAHARNCILTSLQDHSFHELGPQIYRFLFDSDSLLYMYQGQTNHGNFPVMTEAEFRSKALKGDKLRLRDGFVNFQRKVRNALAGRSIDATYAATPFQYYDMVRKSHFSRDYTTLSGTFALSIVEKSCSGWSPSIKATCKEQPAYGLDRIDQELNKGLPVGFSYCSRVLQDKSYRGFPQATPQGDCGMHASVIIGRKRDAKGSCQYLIRNSWGVNTVKYDWKTDQGDIWVDMEALNDNIRDYQVVN